MKNITFDKLKLELVLNGLLILFCTVTNQASAQVHYLMKEHIYGPGEWEQLIYADELPSRSIIVIGVKRADLWLTAFEPYDYYMARLDSNLNLLWEVNIGDPNYTDGWSGILKTRNGNYLIAGVREDAPTGNFRSIRTMSLDTNGIVAWERYYSGGFTDGLYRITELSDGNYMLAAAIETAGWQWTPTLIKIDVNGNEIWRNGQDSLLNYNVHYMSACPDGGVVTMGYQSYSSDAKSYMAKYDSLGDLVWIKYPYGLNDTIPYHLGGIFTKNDGTIVALFPEEHPLTGYEQTFWREYDVTGNMTNEYVLPMYLFANQSTWNSSPLNFAGDKMIACGIPYRNGAVWLKPFDLDRNFEAGVHITDGDSTSTLRSIGYGIQLHDGSYFGVGTSWTINDPSRFYFVRFAPDGRHYAENYPASVEINPNPSADGNFLLQFDSQRDETVYINIRSVTGALIYSTQVFCPANTQTDMAISLEKSSSPSGMYLFEAYTDEYTLRKQLIVARSEN